MPKQKAPISAKQVFSHTPSDGSLKVLFYHLQTVNAFLLTNSFPLPSVRMCKRPQIHVGSLEGFNPSPSKSKRFTTFHILSFADVCDCRGSWFFVSLWFEFYFYLLTQTLTQEFLVTACSYLVCDLRAGSACLCKTIPAHSPCRHCF